MHNAAHIINKTFTFIDYYGTVFRNSAGTGNYKTISDGCSKGVHTKLRVKFGTYRYLPRHTFVRTFLEESPGILFERSKKLNISDLGSK